MDGVKNSDYIAAIYSTCMLFTMWDTRFKGNKVDDCVDKCNDGDYLVD